MTKIGRNKPCPCGSGKKYKKCCLNNEERAASSHRTAIGVPTASPPSSSFSAVAQTHSSMTPYVVARMFEQSEQFAEMKRREPARARRLWTPRRLAALDTEEIVTRLHRLGIDPSPHGYQSLFADRTCAWDISDIWRKQLRRPLSRHDDDFVGLAACELWKRLCPHRPSIEMLDDWMQQGYRNTMDGQLVEACDRWSEVWQVIRPRLQPEMRTCDSSAAAFDGTQALFNWVQDFALELQNVAVDDLRYAEIGIRLCEDVLAQFPDESELFIINFRADLGGFYYLAGRRPDGERILRDLIHDHPDSATGYARLADILAYGARRNEGPIDIQRAERLLQDALARPVTNAADYDLEVRLEDLRKSVAQPGNDDPSPPPS